jgi:MATE family multidrug resistance protein
MKLEEHIGPRIGAAQAYSSWWQEIAATLKLAWPMALTQLGQIAMVTTDLAMLGRLGDKVVAAAALAHAVLFSGFVIGMGIVSAVAPLAAQAYGARQPRLVRRALRVGLWASLLFGLPVSIALLWGGDLLLVLGQDVETARLAQRYLDGMAWCLVPSWAFIALRGFMGAVNRPEPSLWITLAAVPLNGLLAYGLIYGEFGLPRLELLGAGIATTAVSIVMLAATAWVCVTMRPFAKYQVLGRLTHPDWPLMRRLLAIGLPIAGAFMLEMGLFACAALLMGRLGTAALAAHQIALQAAAVLFMVPFGISLAATVRVGHGVGRGDGLAARRAGFSGIALSAAFMAAMTLMIVLWREQVPLLFLGASAAQAADTVAMTATLLLVGTTFFVCDGIQTTAAGALRGLNDTRVPLAFAALSYWLIGFPLAIVLGFRTSLGPAGVWIGLSTGVVVFAALLVARFHLLTAGGRLPASAAAPSQVASDSSTGP